MKKKLEVEKLDQDTLINLRGPCMVVRVGGKGVRGETRVMSVVMVVVVVVVMM